MEGIEFSHPNIIIKFVNLPLSSKGNRVYKCNFCPPQKLKFHSFYQHDIWNFKTENSCPFQGNDLIHQNEKAFLEINQVSPYSIIVIFIGIIIRP